MLKDAILRLHGAALRLQLSCAIWEARRFGNLRILSAVVNMIVKTAARHLD
ncbi:hypothetical protein [Paracoccus aminophilus]|uniref:hypothetical protein n=1 Tax=Paracoccus aminophilus TaxID=34003 RepID=UPI00130DABB8|nr:hypothetical protein [Paracoccus aminophilus]